MGMQTDKTFGWASDGNSALVTPHLEYYRKNRWILEFAALPTGLTPVEGTILRINAKTAARPDISFEETKVERLNGTVKLAGKATYADLQVVFYDAIKMKGEVTPKDKDIPDFSTSDVLQRWIELIYQPSRGDAFGSATNYKGVAYLHMLEPIVLEPGDEESGPTFETAPPLAQSISQSWIFQGLFPKQVAFGELDYGSSEAQEVTATFAYDRAYRVATASGLTN